MLTMSSYKCFIFHPYDDCLSHTDDCESDTEHTATVRVIQSILMTVRVMQSILRL